MGHTSYNPRARRERRQDFRLCKDPTPHVEAHYNTL